MRSQHRDLRFASRYDPSFLCRNICCWCWRRAGIHTRRHLMSDTLKRNFELFWILFSPEFSSWIFRAEIRWSNPRFAELLGLHGLELESIKKADTLHDISRSGCEIRTSSARWRAFLAGHRGPAHDDIETVGSPPRLIERFSRTVSDYGSPVGWLEIYSDVSDRRQTQAAVPTNCKRWLRWAKWSRESRMN